MNVKSYVADVRDLLKTHWWLPTVALPIAGFAIPLHMYASRAFSPQTAARLLSWYALAGGVIVTAVALATTAWSRLVADDTDHFTE